MEDQNMLCSDCIVICCCCQCLVLQIVMFILLKLPYKLVQKTKKYATKKLGRRKRVKIITERKTTQHSEEFVAIGHGGSMRVQVEGFEINDSRHCSGCMEEVENVLEELYQKGEFAFGSFWGKDESGSLATNVDKQEFDCNIVGTISYA